MPEIQTDETPRSRRIAESIGFDDDGMNMLDQIEAAANNDGGYTDFDATVVYATARVAGIPVKPREVVRDLSGVDADDLVRDTRRLVDPLPFDISVEDPIAFVDRYVDELDETMRIPDGFRETARGLCRASTDAGIHSGKSPSGFAAAVVYAASEVDGVGLRQTQIGDVADVTNMTIRKMYRDVIDAADAVSMTPSPNDIPDLVERIADAIDRVPDAVADDASRLASRLATSDDGFVRRTKAEGVAAGAFYVTAERNRFDVSMIEVADAIGVKQTVVERAKDVRRWVDEHGDADTDADRFDDVTYNNLKRLAADAGVTPGPQPTRDDLVETLVDAGVDPE